MSPQYPHPSKFDLPEPNDLRRMRRLADLSQREVAETVGISKSTVGHYEAGHSSARLEHVRALFELYAEELPEPRADGGAPAFQEDPHGIFPPEFWNLYRSIAQAAEVMRGTTPEEEKPRCVECESTNLYYKPGAATDRPRHHKGGRWRCEHCGEHFAEPLAPEADTTEGDERRKVRA